MNLLDRLRGRKNNQGIKEKSGRFDEIVITGDRNTREALRYTDDAATRIYMELSGTFPDDFALVERTGCIGKIEENDMVLRRRSPEDFFDGGVMGKNRLVINATKYPRVPDLKSPRYGANAEIVVTKLPEVYLRRVNLGENVFVIATPTSDFGGLVRDVIEDLERRLPKK